MTQEHFEAQERLAEQQRQKSEEEARQRQERHLQGIRGWMQWITGERKRIAEENERQAYQALVRDREKKDALLAEQLEEQSRLEARTKRLDSYSEQRQQIMGLDKAQYEEMKEGQQERFESAPGPNTTDEPKLNP